MTRKIKLWIESIPNEHEEIEEFEDGATDLEIEEAARDHAMNYVSWGWTELKPPSEDI